MSKTFLFNCDDHYYGSGGIKESHDPISYGWYFAQSINGSVEVWRAAEVHEESAAVKHFCAFDCFTRWAKKELNPPTKAPDAAHTEVDQIVA